MSDLHLPPFWQGVTIRVIEFAVYVVLAFVLSALTGISFALFAFMFAIGVVLRHAQASRFVDGGINWLVRDPLFWAAKKLDTANCKGCGTSVFDGRQPTGYASHGAEDNYWPHSQCQNCGIDLKLRQTSAR